MEVKFDIKLESIIGAITGSKQEAKLFAQHGEKLEDNLEENPITKRKQTLDLKISKLEH